MSEPTHTHDHDHEHGDCCAHHHDHAGHEHTHAGPEHAHHHHHHEHDHDHEGDSYFLDQLCMVGLSGMFGVVCLSLYLWQTTMLGNLLGPQFHLYVLLSGIVLVAIALVRGMSLWAQAGKTPLPHAHDHDHAHQVVDLELVAHTHAHEHAADAAAHAHSHGHHHHHQDHGAEDHDHGWAPWRYVVLLVPLVLFLLGLPNKGPSVEVKDAGQVDYTQEATGYASLVAVGPAPLHYLGLVSGLHRDEAASDATPVDYKVLEGAAANEELRRYWNHKTIQVRGQFSRDPGNEFAFNLVRFRIQCCAADRIQLDVPIFCKEKVQDIPNNEWVKVTGKVLFRPRGNGYVTVVLVASRNKIEPCPPETTFVQ